MHEDNLSDQLVNPLQLTYQPLEQPISLGEVKQKIQASRLTLVATWITTILVVALALVATPITIQSTGSVIAGMVVLTIICLVAVVAVGAGIHVIKRRLRLERFAAVNGMTLLTAHNTQIGQYQGVIFQAGHSRQVTEGFRLPGVQGFEIANFSYITGHGKSSQYHRYGFIRLRLPRKLPNMVLDARANNFLSHFSNLPAELRSDQKISLEGNFDDYFTLYAPKQYEVDARYIFTPDVMSFFIDHLQDFDVEIIDDSLYLYTKTFAFRNMKRFREAMQIIVGLQQQLHRQSSRYSDDLAANTPQHGGIALQGRRLQRGHVLTGLTVAAIIGVSLIFFFLSSNGASGS